MTDKEIIQRAKEAEKRTGFGELVHSPISKGVNSAFGIGFIEGMIEYRNSLQEESASEDLTDEIRKAIIENLFACTEPSELKKERVIEIANELTPFVVKLAKEYMLKDSVDAECSTLLYANGDEVRYAVQYPKGKRPVNRGDKVKLIIIKEN